MKEFKINKDLTVKLEKEMNYIYVDGKLLDSGDKSLIIQILETYRKNYNRLDEEHFLEEFIPIIFENLNKFLEKERHEILYALLKEASPPNYSDPHRISRSPIPIFTPHMPILLEAFQKVSTKLNKIYFTEYLDIFWYYEVKEADILFVLKSLEKYQENLDSEIDLVMTLAHIIKPFLRFTAFLTHRRVTFFDKNYARIAKLFGNILDRIDLIQDERDFLLSLDMSYHPYSPHIYRRNFSRWTFNEFIRYIRDTKLFEDFYSRIEDQFLKRLNHINSLDTVQKKENVFIALIECIENTPLLDKTFPLLLKSFQQLPPAAKISALYKLIVVSKKPESSILLDMLHKLPIKEKYRSLEKIASSSRKSEIIHQNISSFESLVTELLDNMKEVPAYKDDDYDPGIPDFDYYQNKIFYNLVKLIKGTTLMESYFIDFLNTTGDLKLASTRFTTLRWLIKAIKGTNLPRIHFLPLLKKISTLDYNKSEAIFHLNETLVNHINLEENEINEALSYIEAICTGSTDQLVKAHIFALMEVPEEKLKLDLKLLKALSKEGDIHAKSKLREGLVKIANQGNVEKLATNSDCIKYIMQEDEEGDNFLIYIIEQLGLDYKNKIREFERVLWDNIGLLDFLPEAQESHRKIDWYGLRVLASKKFEYYLSKTLKEGGPETLKPILHFLSTKVPKPKDPDEFYDIYEYLHDTIAIDGKKFYKNYEEAKEVVIIFVKENPISSNAKGYKSWYFTFVWSFLENEFWKVIENGDKLIELARIWHKNPQYYDIGIDDGDYCEGLVRILIEKNQIVELWIDLDQSDLSMEAYIKIYRGKSEEMNRLISSFSALKKLYVIGLLRLDQVSKGIPHTVEFLQFLETLKTLRSMLDELKKKGLEIEYISL